ncbi:hypothetical protein VTK26DRAFT_9041 [Humicola hyalothermophila]
MDSPYRRELEVAIGAVRTAAHISRVALLSAQSQTHENKKDASPAQASFDLVKDDLSPVTIADFAIQAVLARILGSAFPGDRLVGEESADELRHNPKLLSRVLAIIGECGAGPLFRDGHDLCNAIDSCTITHPAATTTSQSLPDTGRTWVFDPIDGTKTFIRGEQYAINIALLRDPDAQQVLGVVACPLLSESATGPVLDSTTDPTGTGCILYAVKGHGAYVMPLFTNHRPSSPSPSPSEPSSSSSSSSSDKPRRLPRHADDVTAPSALRSATCWTHLDSGISSIHRTVAARLSMPFPGCDLLGWVPRWAVMALGQANTTVWVYKTRTRHAKVWDHAGAMLLFEEVGGVVTDVDGKAIDLGAGRKLTGNFGFVAAPRGVHHLVLGAVQDALRAEGKGELLEG